MMAWSRLGGRCGLVLFIGIHLLALLACTSNDTLFIQLTATPIATPTTAPSLSEGRFSVGARLTYVAINSPSALLAAPAITDKSPTALCFTATSVTVQEVRKVGPHTFYRVTCASQQGWTLENNLTALKSGDHITLRTEAYLTNDPEPDNPTTPNRASSKPCPAQQPLSIFDFALNPTDQKIYLNVQCGAANGWLPEPQP